MSVSPASAGVVPEATGLVEPPILPYLVPRVGDPLHCVVAPSSTFGRHLERKFRRLADFADDVSVPLDDGFGVNVERDYQVGREEFEIIARPDAEIAFSAYQNARIVEVSEQRAVGSA